MEGYADSLILPLRVLGLLGLKRNKRGNAKSVVFAGCLHMTLCAIAFFTQIIQLPNFSGDVSEFVSIAEALSASAYCFGIIASFLLQRTNFWKMIQQTSSMPKINNCKDSVRPELNNLLKNNKRIQIFLLVCMGIATVGFILASLIKQALPLGVWNLQKHKAWFTAILIAQLITLVIVILFVFAFDCVFMACCIEMVVQFRILRHYFNELDVSRYAESHSDYHKEMKSHIKHHIFILKFLKLLQEVYSIEILLTYLLLTPVVGFEMYAALESKNVLEKFKHGQTGLTILARLAFYAIPADYVMHEASTVGNAIYASNWYHEYFPTLRKPLEIIIQKSNVELIFKAGGLVYINSKSLITIIKLSWSACTLMRGLKRIR